MFDISVDQFFYTEGHRGEGSCRKSIDVMLNTMNEKKLVVMKATAEGLKKARETEVSERRPPPPLRSVLGVCHWRTAPPNPASDQHGPKSQRRFAPYIGLKA